MSFFSVTKTYAFPTFLNNASADLKNEFMEAMKSLTDEKRTEFFNLFETVEREYGVNPCRFVCKYGLDNQSATAYYWTRDGAQTEFKIQFHELNLCKEYVTFKKVEYQTLENEVKKFFVENCSKCIGVEYLNHANK
jgi:hypothetical protein